MKQFLTSFAFLLLTVLFLQDSAFSQDTYIYAALTDEGNIAVVDPGSSRLLQRIQVGREPMYVALNADKSRLYVSNTGDITVSIVDFTDAREVQVLRLPVNRRGINAGVLIRNWEGTRMYIAERADDETRDLRVYVIDTQKENIVAQFDAGKNISSMAVSSDGTKLFVVNKGEGVRIFDTQTNQPMGSLKVIPDSKGEVWGIACSPTKDIAYVSYGKGNKVQAFNTATNKQITVIPMPKYKTGIQKDISFSPDGRYAFVLNHKNTFKEIDGVNVIDAKTNKVIKIFNAGVVLHGLSVTDDAKTCYVASKDLKWYNLLTLEHIRSISLRTTIGGIVVVER